MTESYILKEQYFGQRYWPGYFPLVLLVVIVTPTCRTFTIEPESRLLSIAGETRELSIDPENRTLVIGC